jgi:hypothetical protein
MRHWFVLLFFVAGIVVGAGSYAAVSHGAPQALAAVPDRTVPPPGVVDRDLPVPVNCDHYTWCLRPLPYELHKSPVSTARMAVPSPMPSRDGLVGMPTIGTGNDGGNINSSVLQERAHHAYAAALKGYTVITLYEHDDAANSTGDKDRLMQSIWVKIPKGGIPLVTCPYNPGVGYCSRVRPKR